MPWIWTTFITRLVYPSALVWDGSRGDVPSTSSDFFAIEVDPIAVDGRLDGVEEAPMVDGC